MTTADQLLAQFKEIQAKYDLLLADREKAMQSVLTPAQIQQMADIDEEYEDVIGFAKKELEALKKQVKGAVLRDEESCKLDTIEALFIKGRTKWDDEMLNDMVFDYPLISTARLPPKPYVTIRNRK